MPHFDDTILQAIPEPALVCADGRVVCFNPAAAQVFPDLAQNGPQPEALPRHGDGAGLLLAGGLSWQFTASPVKDGTLFLLHPARLEGMSRAQLDGTMRRLREQMSGLLLNVQLLTQSLAEGDASRARLAGMNRSLCQMLRLTDQLDLLRDLESGEFRFDPVTLDLAGLCLEVVTAAAYLLEQAGVTLRFESALSSLLVRGDSNLLQNLLLELMVNAARAAGKGGTVLLTLARYEERAVLTLGGPGKDDGRSLTQLLTGDTPEDRIPQPGEGAGSGLVLVQRVTALHKGVLMMERRDGVSTILALPLAPKDNALPVHTPPRDYAGGFSPALVALSDLLPDRVFSHLDVE